LASSAFNQEHIYVLVLINWVLVNVHRARPTEIPRAFTDGILRQLMAVICLEARTS